MLRVAPYTLLMTLKVSLPHWWFTFSVQRRQRYHRRSLNALPEDRKFWSWSAQVYRINQRDLCNEGKGTHKVGIQDLCRMDPLWPFPSIMHHPRRCSEPRIWFPRRNMLWFCTAGLGDDAKINMVIEEHGGSGAVIGDVPKRQSQLVRFTAFYWVPKMREDFWACLNDRYRTIKIAMLSRLRKGC